MSELLRLSEHYLCQRWLAQFQTSEDRSIAARLVNQLKLVSHRTFELAIETALIDLQSHLNAKIAVYPIAPPIPDEIIGYSPFTGGIAKTGDSRSRDVGKRRKYGSEDRVGHLLAKLQEKLSRGTGSIIECAPTLTHLNAQGLKHIVLVDDISGSGTRIVNYWKRSVPKRIKSLLSLKKLELWILLYAITPAGYQTLKDEIPNFPITDHLITILPPANLQQLGTHEFEDLCRRYATSIDRDSAALGYRNSGSPIVFEHGCPNNVPAIFWEKSREWSGLFPNRAVPLELRECFDGDNAERAIESLWRSNQPKLALNLLDALEDAAPMEYEQRMLLTILGLRMRGIPVAEMRTRLLLSEAECKKVLRRSVDMGLYNKATGEVTAAGKEFVARFRERFGHNRQINTIGSDPSQYYPIQCEGKLRDLGKTDGAKVPSGPVEHL